jgi:hypothetical protein
MINWIEDIELNDIFNLTIEERVKVINSAVDLIFQECIISGQMYDMKPSALLNKVLVKIELQITQSNEYENFEMAYFLTEIKWGITNRLNDLKKEKGNVFL